MGFGLLASKIAVPFAADLLRLGNVSGDSVKFALLFMSATYQRLIRLGLLLELILNFSQFQFRRCDVLLFGLLRVQEFFQLALLVVDGRRMAGDTLLKLAKHLAQTSGFAS